METGGKDDQIVQPLFDLTNEIERLRKENEGLRHSLDMRLKLAIEARDKVLNQPECKPPSRY